MIIKNQNGVALVVGLVMLLVLTILGVSSMSGTTLELKIASNSQAHNVAFQCSSAAIEKAVREGNFFDIDNDEDFVYVAADGISDCAAEMRKSYFGCSRVLGGSLERAGSRNVFQIQSTGSSTNAVAKSTQFQGVGIPTPASCPGN